MFSTSQEEDIIFSMDNEDFKTLEDSLLSSQLDFLKDFNFEQELETFSADCFFSNLNDQQLTVETSLDVERPLENLFDLTQNDIRQDFHVVQLESPSVSSVEIRTESSVSSFNDNDLSSFADNSNFDTSSCASMPIDFSSISICSKAKKSKQTQRLQRSILEKKEANKAATVRYRSKKVKERDELFAQVSEYSKKNSELKHKIENLQSEIGCIKNLIIQIYVKKNS